MKILGKNVYIGNICICTEYTSQIISDLDEIYIGEKSHEGKILEKDVLFIKDAHGLYVDARDTEGIGSLAIRAYGAAKRFKRAPHNAGDCYIDVKHYYSKAQFQDQFNLKDLLTVAKNLHSGNELSL